MLRVYLGGFLEVYRHHARNYNEISPVYLNSWAFDELAIRGMHLGTPNNDNPVFLSIFLQVVREYARVLCVRTENDCRASHSIQELNVMSTTCY